MRSTNIPWKSSRVAADPDSSQMSRSPRIKPSEKRQSLPETSETACSPKSAPVNRVEANPANEEIELSDSPPMVAAHPLKMVVEARIPAKATGRMTDSTN
jgi:hypothetical protein